MSLTDTMTSLANQFRKNLYFGPKLGLDDMISLASVQKMVPATETNLLRNTDPKDIDPWYLGSGGNGTLNLINLDSTFKAKHGFQIANNTNGKNRDIVQGPLLLAKGIYTFSVKVKPISSNPVQIIIRSYDQTNHSVFEKWFPQSSFNTWQKFSYTFDFSNLKLGAGIGAGIQFGFNGVGTVDFAEPMLEAGDTAHDWSPSPIDGLKN